MADTDVRIPADRPGRTTRRQFMGGTADLLLREDAAALFTHAQSELYGVNTRYAWKPWAFADNAGRLTWYIPKA